MRPLRLSFQSFGSYAERATVDFDRPELNMFLISGDTGSGKSTIFDALCYALYGAKSTSGSQKPEQIQSQYARTDRQPFVELDFLGSDGLPYRIRRVPPHERAKKRGTGTKQELASVCLTTPDGELTGARDVNARIEELVGLTKDQFTQVAMIAQGEFMRILSMNTTDRKVIFQKLFNTSVYARIIARIKEELAERDRKVVSLREALKADAAGFRVPEEYERKEIFDEARQAFREKAEVSARLSDFLSEAERLVTWNSEARAQAEKDRERLREAALEASARFRAAEDLDGRFAEMEAARGRFQELQAKVQEIESKRNLAQRIEDAWFVSDKHGEYSRNQARANELEEAVRKAENALPEREEKAARIGASAQEAREEQIRITTECEAALERIRMALGFLDEYDEAKREEEQARKRVAATLEREQELQRRWQTAGQERQSLEDRTRALSGAADRWNEWRLQRQEAKELEEKAAVYEKELDDYRSKERSSKLAAARKEKAEAACAKAEQEYENAQEALTGAEAARLAASLRPGRPCPVCGSADHPHPCLGSLPEDVRAFLDQAEELRKTRENARIQLEGANARLDEAQKNKANSETRARDAFEALRGQYREYGAKHPDTSPADVSSKDACDAVRALVGSLDALERPLREEKELCGKLEAELEKKTKEEQALKAELADQKTAAARRGAELESAAAAAAKAQGWLVYTDRAQASADAERTRSRREEANARAERAQKEAEQARTDVQKTKQAIETNRDNLRLRRKDLETTRLSYQAAMEERSLSEDDWQTCVRQRRREEAKLLREETAAFDRRFSASQQTYRERLRDVEGKERPNLDALSEAEKDAKEREEQAAVRSGELAVAAQTNRACWEKMRDEAGNSEKASREYAVAEGLFQAVAGKRKGGNMDLEAFAQRQYLESVLRSANERLRRMTQYELQMVPEDVAAGQGLKNQGLDLRVLSLATGKTRDISTLSGGESFMAALCMALGLADQIESSSAAVRLDFLFLDEGFGSLDKKACREAIRVLEETVGESRMVGVISHVETLRETIPDQLLVTKDLNGSHLKWKE